MFYLATKGSGEFFGKVGSFDEDMSLMRSLLMILKHPQELTIRERLERLIYLADDRNVVEKYIGGKKVFASNL